MSEVRANVGANVGDAQRNIGGVIGKLRELRGEMQRFSGGVRVVNPAELAALSKELGRLTAASRDFSRLDFSGVDQATRRVGTTIQRNLGLYSRALGHTDPQARDRMQEQLRGGANPLALDFGRMFSGMHGAQLQRQIEFFYSSLLRNTNLRHPTVTTGHDAGGGGASAGAAAGAAGRAGSFVGAGLNAQLGGFLRAIPGMAGVGGLLSLGGFAASSVGVARESALLSDSLGRRTTHPIDALSGLTQAFEDAGRAVGQTGREALRTATTWARAAQEADSAAIVAGYETAAGLARAYGMEPDQLAQPMGQLTRYGVIGESRADQRAFAVSLATAIRDGGMVANPEMVLNDLLSYVQQRASATGSAPDLAERDAFLGIRGAMYNDPAGVLRGEEGMAMIQRVAAKLAGGGDMASQITFARALDAAGVSHYAQQQYARESGLFFDLGKLGGQSGQTVLGAVMQQLQREFGGMDYYLGLAGASSVLGLSMPQVERWREMYAQAETRAAGSFGRAMGVMREHGIDPMALAPDALKEAVDAALAGDIERLKGIAGEGRTQTMADTLRTNTAALEALQLTIGDPLLSAVEGLKGALVDGTADLVDAIERWIRAMNSDAATGGFPGVGAPIPGGNEIRIGPWSREERRRRKLWEINNGPLPPPGGQPLSAREELEQKIAASTDFDGGGTQTLRNIVYAMKGVDGEGSPLNPKSAGSILRRIEQQTGIKPDQVLDMNDAAQMEKTLDALLPHYKGGALGDKPWESAASATAVSGESVVRRINYGATRNKPITETLDARVSDAVRAVYGDGARADLYSGGQDIKGQGTRRTGTTRHDGGKAGDFYIVGPDGNRIKGDALGPLAQYWLARGYGGVGLEMRGGGIHLDEHTDRPLHWNYANNKGGRYTPGQAAAVKAGMEGKLPPLVPKPEVAAPPVPLDDRATSYVPDPTHAVAITGNNRDRFGELTLHIDQRLNGEQRSFTSQRLKAGSGVDWPRLHGFVELPA